MKRTIVISVILLLLIVLLSITAVFGLNLGFCRVPSVQDGIKLGLDLVGGSEITYEAVVPDGDQSVISEGMGTAISMLRQRLNTLGYTEANVYQSGDSRIVVEIPNVDNPEDAVQMLGKTAVIQFKDYQDNVILDGSDIESATAQYGPLSGTDFSQYYVQLNLTDSGYEKFVEATRVISGYTDGNNYLAIVMDDEQISAPIVDETIDTRTPVITLGMQATADEAQYLAEIISAGKLPFSLTEAKLQAVDATLGSKSLETSILAGIIGVILVMLFMAVFYKIPGLIADIALIVYILLFLVIMSITGMNLSLPGIAGIILTVGMAVDANVVIYERLKDELRNGKTLRAAVDCGFKRALTAIVDSNITTAIAAVVLLIFGTGTILGFAKTLLIGVLLSMVCMLLIPQALLKSISGLKIGNFRAFGAPVQDKVPLFTRLGKKFSFIKKKAVFFIISAVLCLPGVIGLIVMPFGVSLFNVDLDFAGGVSTEYEIGRVVTQDIQDDISDTVASIAGVIPHISVSGDEGTSVVVKTTEISSDVRNEIYQKLSEEYGDQVKIISSDYVSAAVGDDLRDAAFKSAIIAALLILVYITIRFALKSGIAAVLCLIHDLLVMFTFMLLFRIPLNMTFIAAALTILGYSINATIIVFDRVRENQHLLGGKVSFSVIVDQSIWQTLMRSVCTTVTTLIPVILIVCMGVTSIRIFALPLLVGIVSGSYSSTCLAGALWDTFHGNKAGIKRV